jgi:hypothetical protein
MSNFGVCKGKGVFLWQLSKVDKPSVLAANAKKYGVDWVTIKITDGNAPFNKGLVENAISEFQKNNIKVTGWSYVYGYDPKGEATAIEKYIKQYGFSEIILDVEDQYKGKPTQASILMKQLKSSMPNIPVAICSYRFPSLHQELPWAKFSLCDAVMPQVYWTKSNDSAGQLLQCYNEYKKFLNKDFIPVGAAYGEYGWRPTNIQIKDFVNKCNDLSIDSFSWWEWQQMDVYDYWASCFGKEDQSQSLNMVKLYTTISYLRVRKQPVNGEVICYLTANKIYSSSKNNGIWYFVDELNGWVHGSYVDFK